jgi:hypothetical protein
MTALSGESPGPYVPRKLFDRLSSDEQAEVRHRVRKFVLRTYSGSVILKTPEEKTSFAHLCVALILKYKSCDYLTDTKGIETLVRLAVNKARYLYLNLKEKYVSDLKRGLEPSNLLEEYHDDWENHQAPLASNNAESASDADAEPSKRLRDWFKGKAQSNNYHRSTREKLNRLIDLIFDPDGNGEPFYTFDGECISLKAGPIAKALGWQDDNLVSKLAGKLNEIISNSRGANPVQKSS